MLSTITRVSSCGLISLISSATLIVCARSSSTPSSPSNWRNLTRVVASQGRWCSKYAWPEKNCQVGVSPQRSTTPSSDSLNACLRYSSETMMRSATRGRPALLAAAWRWGFSPNKSRSGMACPAWALRTSRWATRASISCQGMREDSTASGWRRSIIWSMRERKKSSVAGQVNITARNSQKSRRMRYQNGRNYTPE
ncbi:hypothetical protein D9M71_642030 [compost metagenome]